VAQNTPRPSREKAPRGVCLLHFPLHHWRIGGENRSGMKIRSATRPVPVRFRPFIRVAMKTMLQSPSNGDRLAARRTLTRHLVRRRSSDGIQPSQDGGSARRCRREGSDRPSPLFSEARLSYDAISQCCGINQAAARQIDNTGRNNLATLLVACVNLQSGAGFLKALDIASIAAGPKAVLSVRCLRIGIGKNSCAARSSRKQSLRASIFYAVALSPSS
jgi:hypothetical protein